MPNAEMFFIVADTYLRNIYQVDVTSGATAQLLRPGAASSPVALAYDSAAKLLYWSDNGTHTINRYSLVTPDNTVIYRDPANAGIYVWIMTHTAVVSLSIRLDNNYTRRNCV